MKKVLLILSAALPILASAAGNYVEYNSQKTVPHYNYGEGDDMRPMEYRDPAPNYSRVRSDTPSAAKPMAADFYASQFYTNWSDLGVEEKANARRKYWDPLTLEQKSQVRKQLYQN